MSFKIDMTSTDVDRQVYLLRHFPDIAQRHYRPALEASVKLLSNLIQPDIPVGFTGKARATFRSKVTGRQIHTMRGRVGWWGKNAAWYINVVEHGATAHTIKAKRGKTLRFPDVSGRSRDAFAFPRQVHHPGFSARGFMAAGESAARPVIDALMAQASDRVVKELAAI